VPFIIVLRFVTPVDTFEASDTFKMLRFLSRRKGRNVQKTSTQVAPGSQRLISNKHLVACRVILLDGTDLSIDLSVSIFKITKHVSSKISIHCYPSVGQVAAYLAAVEYHTPDPVTCSVVSITKSNISVRSKVEGFVIWSNIINRKQYWSYREQYSLVFDTEVN